MINILTLALTHVLMAWAAWKLVQRDDLDEDSAAARPASRWLKQRADAPAEGEG